MGGVRAIASVVVAVALAADAAAGDDEKRAGTRVVVTGVDEKPAGDATVRMLPLGDSDADGEWISWPAAHGLPAEARKRLELAYTARTDAGGVAKLAVSCNSLCVLVFRGNEAALHCAVPESTLEDGTKAYVVKLEPAMAITGRLAGPDGKPVAGARLRLEVAGGEEWHSIDAGLAADGTFRLPPVPGRLLRKPDTHIEARAPGCVDARVAVGEKDAGGEIEVRFARARLVRGKLHAEGAISNALVRTAERVGGPLSRPQVDGSFSLDRLSPATHRIYVESRSHATRIIDLPVGDDDTDLGVVELEQGHAVQGKVLGPDGGKSGELEVALMDELGHELASMQTDVRGVFDFSHVGAGADHLAAWAGGVGEALWILDRGRLEGELAAPPFVVTFRDPTGRRTQVDNARFTWKAGDRTESWVMGKPSQVFTMGVASVRLRLPGPGSLRVEIEGREPVVLDKVDVAADGTGEATVTIAK